MGYLLNEEISSAKQALRETWAGYTDEDRAVYEAWDAMALGTGAILDAAMDNRIQTDDVVETLRSRIADVVFNELWTYLEELKRTTPKCEWCDEYLTDDQMFDGEPLVHLENDEEVGFCSEKHLEEYLEDEKEWERRMSA